jgi:hypothetical protein
VAHDRGAAVYLALLLTMLAWALVLLDRQTAI